MRVAAAFTLCLLLGTTVAQAQEPPAWDTTVKGRISFTQAGFYRWHDGGVSTLALSAGVNGEAQRTGIYWKQTYEVNLAYGLVKQNDISLRKAEDVIHAYLSFANTDRRILGVLAPAVAVDFRSQFRPGFDYTAADDGKPAPKISDFLAPATLVETLGLQVDALEFVLLDVGAAAKQTIVQDPSLRERYKVRATRAVRNEIGASTVIKLDRVLATNVHLDHALALFASFNRPDRPDLFSTTHLTLTVNSWLHVNLEYVAKLDLDVSKPLQMKELVSLGVTLVVI